MPSNAIRAKISRSSDVYKIMKFLQLRLSSKSSLDDLKSEIVPLSNFFDDFTFDTSKEAKRQLGWVREAKLTLEAYRVNAMIGLVETMWEQYYRYDQNLGSDHMISCIQAEFVIPLWNELVGEEDISIIKRKSPSLCQVGLDVISPENNKQPVHKYMYESFLSVIDNAIYEYNKVILEDVVIDLSRPKGTP